jgi:hypothetical protein
VDPQPTGLYEASPVKTFSIEGGLQGSRGTFPRRSGWISRGHNRAVDRLPTALPDEFGIACSFPQSWSLQGFRVAL